MSRIYSNSYFHYTKEFHNLKGILANGFKGSYCKEEFKVDNEIKKLYIPMVSFCDVPLAHISQITYGQWGIGMSASWGNEIGLTPVCYFPNNAKAALTTYISTIAGKLFQEKQNNGLVKCDTILAYAKPRTKYTESKHRADNYIERESRKAYTMCSLDSSFHRQQHPSMLLTFSPKDVSFIIVPNEEGRKKLIDAIVDLKTLGGNNHVLPTEILTLISKIITYEEIKENY